MKIGVYSAREDEKEFIEQFSRKYGAEIEMIDENPVLETTDRAKGCQCISIITNTFITRDMLDRYKELGVRFISTRTVGYEHIDVKYARTVGIGVSNVSYTPSSVAEYTLMMMLMVLRNVKHMSVRMEGQDYTISKIRGRLISDLTVGLMGTGRIGARVAELLTGFGCRILAYDLYPNEKLNDIVEYTDLDTLYQTCDIISLHMPSTAENQYIINADVFDKMKPNAILINTARGDLVDSNALIEAIESGNLGGAGLDVFDGDRLIYYRDRKSEPIRQHDMAVLNFLPNVLMLPHMAFYTDHSVSDMVENSIKSCVEYIKEHL
ncbi:MAG: D-isomer specific 2-hydroxyacid dehydrogenase family protein [Lachnospiraceae bacterium]